MTSEAIDSNIPLKNMRLLKSHEAKLIKILLLKNSSLAKIFIPLLDTVLVEDADDGGMGGLIFMSQINNADRTIGQKVAETEFIDEDGVLVSVELSLDNNNQLFELDVWKVDYSPLCRNMKSNLTSR
jgi:hypothetical protein